MPLLQYSEDGKTYRVDHIINDTTGRLSFAHDLHRNPSSIDLLELMQAGYTPKANRFEVDYKHCHESPYLVEFIPVHNRLVSLYNGCSDMLAEQANKVKDENPDLQAAKERTLKRDVKALGMIGGAHRYIQQREIEKLKRDGILN